LLSEYSYLPEGLQSAEKQKHTQKQSLKMHAVLPETEATVVLFTFGLNLNTDTPCNKNLYQLCKQQLQSKV